MGYMRDSTGRRLDSFEVLGAADAAGKYTRVGAVRKDRTSGNVSLSSITWTSVDTNLDITLTGVSAGDMIEVATSGRWNAEANFGFLDVASIIAGSPVNYWSGATLGTHNGVQGWLGESGVRGNIAGSVVRAVTGADLSSGSLTLRLMMRANAASPVKTMMAAGDNPLTFWARNLGPFV